MREAGWQPICLTPMNLVTEQSFYNATRLRCSVTKLCWARHSTSACNCITMDQHKCILSLNCSLGRTLQISLSCVAANVPDVGKLLHLRLNSVACVCPTTA